MHNESRFEIRLWNVAKGGQDTELARHLATCDDCREELMALRELVHYGVTTGGGLADVPESLMRRLTALMPVVRPDLIALRAPSVVDGLVERVRRYTANLILDSGVTPYVVGLRGGGDQQTRQLAFVSEVADLDLEVSNLEGTYSVAGQLGMDTVPSNLQIRFVPADQDPLADMVTGLVQTAISQGGYFELTLTAGDWVAAVDIEDAVVLFPGVRL